MSNSSVAYLVPAIHSRGLTAVNDNRNEERAEQGRKASAQSNDQMLMLLGELKAGLEEVHRAVAEIKTEAGEDRKDTADSRRRMHEIVGTVDKRLIKLESTVHIMGGVVDNQTKRIDKLEPTVKATAVTVRVWTIRGGLIGTAALAVIGFVYANWTNIWRALTAFFTSP